MSRAKAASYEIRVRSEVGTESGSLKVLGYGRRGASRHWGLQVRCACGNVTFVDARNWYSKRPQSCRKCAGKRRAATNRVKQAMKVRRSLHSLTPEQKEAVALMMKGRQFVKAGDCTTTYDACIREAVEMACQFSLEDIKAWFDSKPEVRPAFQDLLKVFRERG